ncbi:hypothetical protein OSB04_009803, partial [Centaurea solstitialis]
MDHPYTTFRRRLSSSSSSTSSMTLSSSYIVHLLLLCVFAPINPAMAFDLNTITFNQGYAPLFSDFNIHRSQDDRSVRILLNRQSVIFDIWIDETVRYYIHGFIQFWILQCKNQIAKEACCASKLIINKHSQDRKKGCLEVIMTKRLSASPETSNVDMFPMTHDELDMEFLGNVRGKPWRFQTNVYGNGSTIRGREERYRLWFDPSQEFHRYSILWARNKIIFYVDEIPIREILRDENMGGDYPSKPMSSYATIWDASSWATNGGRNKVDYQFEPFTSEFQDLVLQGCAVDPTDATSTNCLDAIDELESSEFATITPRQRQAKKWFREKYMYYSYCYDRLRYPSPLPECPLISSEQDLFKNTGRLKNRQSFPGDIGVEAHDGPTRLLYIRSMINQ